MQRPTNLTPDDSSQTEVNHGSGQGEATGPQIPRVVIESTGQTRFASSVLRVLSMQRFYKKTGRRSRDSWLERYTGTYQEDRDWRRPLMRRSASNSPQVQSPTSEGTGSSRDASDARLDKASCNCTLVFDPSGDLYFFWLIVVVLGILYNYWMIIFRVAFFVREQKFVIPFMAIDYSCDFVFLLDIIVQFRTGYFLDGKIVTDTKQLAKRYMKSRGFFLDCVSILPVDLLFLVLGPRPALRFGRLLKAHRLFLFCDRVEIYSGRPKLFNLLKQIHYLFLIIHWVACFYFLLSYMEGFGADKWLHPKLEGQWEEVGPQYLYSLFRSLVSMTTVGTGNAADMIVDLRRHREKYHRKLDGMKEYIAANQLPMDLQRRVIQWFDFAWRNKKDMSEEELFQQLNDNIRAEIAIHVNLDTLKKVKMFEHCDPGFLRELVLKLKPMLCSPGDYVCRQDEIGREMYIVNQGELAVVDKRGAPLAKLSAGRHFGEISILDIKGIGNRRTASVRSVGFSDLFRLSKADLEEVLAFYPEEKEQLAKIARQTYEKQRRERMNQKVENDDLDKDQLTEDSRLQGHDPRKWLVADKETLKRRLSLIEAKNEVKALASRFRRENGNSTNPREIVAAIAERGRQERPDEDARKIIKEFLAKDRGSKIHKRSTMSHESLLAHRSNYVDNARENCFKDASYGENCANDQTRKSQRRFFSRPHSRTMESKPSSPTGKDIPLLAFKENDNVSDQKRGSQIKDLSPNPVAFTLNSTKEKGIRPPFPKKGILKRTSGDSSSWQGSDSMETSFSALENAKSDEDNPTCSEQSKEESAKNPKQKSKFKVPFLKEQKKDDVKILLATPENSEIVEDSPKLERAANRMNSTGKNPFTEIKVNSELDFIAPDKRCTCQQEAGHKNERLHANCLDSECQSVTQKTD